MKKLIYTLVLLAFAVSLNAQWVQVPNGMGTGKEVTSFAKATVSDYIYAGTNLYGVYRSDDLGENWSQFGLSGQSVFCIAAIGNYKIAGTAYGIYYTQDSVNSNWILSNYNQNVNSLIVIGSNVFAGSSSGVLISTNNGVNWTTTNLSYFAISFASSGSTLFAGTAGNGVYLTTNNGVNWSQAGLSGQWIRSIGILGTNIFADYGNSTGLYKSTNNGVNWAITGLTGRNTYSIVLNGNTIIAGAGNFPAGVGGVYSSGDYGATWSTKNQGFTTIPTVNAMIISNNYIFVGTQGQSIWRRPLSDIIGIQNISTEIPSSFSLSQNYPNPFNPSSVVRFQLPAAGFTTLKVYDMMGREVQTLVNEKLQAGTYETTFDGSKLSSGMYFYRLETEGYTETRKMTLIK